MSVSNIPYNKVSNLLSSLSFIKNKYIKTIDKIETKIKNNVFDLKILKAAPVLWSKVIVES